MNRPDQSQLQQGVKSLKFTKTDANSLSSGTTTVRFSAARQPGVSPLSFDNPNYPSSGQPAVSTSVMADAYKEFDRSDTSPIIPEIRINNYSIRIREIILGVVALAAIIACLVLIALVAKGSGPEELAPSVAAQIAQQTFCTEPPCLRAASWAVSNMNTSVDPCDDFYGYACGNYAKLNPLNPDVSQRTIFWNLYYDNEDRLRELLESPSTRDSPWSYEKKLKDFFMSCVDDYGKMKVGGKAFLDKIVTPLGGWSVLGTLSNTSFNLQTALQKTSIDFWTAALFTFRVTTDRYDRSRRVIEVGTGLQSNIMIYETAVFV